MTYKVLKSCRSKMATLAHDVCGVHGASTLHIKTGFSLLRGWGVGGGVGPPTTKNLLIHPPPHQIFIPSHQKSIEPNKKIKTSFLAIVIAPVAFLP